MEPTESDRLQSAKLRAAEFKSKRLSAGTHRTYVKYQALFVEWFQEHYPELVAFSDNLEPAVKLEKLSYERLEEFICDVKSKKTKEFLSTIALKTMRSAIKCLYVDEGLAVPSFWDLDLSTLYIGMKKGDAKNKRLGECIEEGKSHFSFTIYSWLMEFLMKKEGRKSPFCHIFGLLSWNLICRGDNTASISFHHISWEQDCMVFRFSQSKNDQTGERISGEKKHVFANPFMPFLCPVLSLAVYLATTAFLEDAKMLFPGSGQKERKLATMQSALKTEDAKIILDVTGRVAEDFGNHSFRKGATTYATSGSVGGPSGFSVLLRGGWNVAGVISRYLKLEAAGDQFVGRVLAGLPINDTRFAVVPPSFQEVNETVIKAISSMFQHCAQFKNMKEVLLYCLASLVHHSNYIIDTLPASHPIFNSYLFKNRGILAVLQRIVEISEDRIVATGVPPHVSILRELHVLASQKDDILSGVQDILAKHGALALHATTHQLEQVETRILAILEKAMSSRTLPEPRSVQAGNDNALPTPFYWNNSFHRVPADFSLPAVSVETAFHLWMDGNPARQEPPYRHLEASDMPPSGKPDPRKWEKVRSDWRIVMRFIFDGLKTAGVICSNMESNALWKEVKRLKLLEIKTKKNNIRCGERCITTAVKYIRKRRRNINQTRS